MKNILEAIVYIRQNYNHHPCGMRFCRCGWPKIPPAYFGDYWDCANPLCAKSFPPSKSDLKKMAAGVRK